MERQNNQDSFAKKWEERLLLRELSMGSVDAKVKEKIINLLSIEDFYLVDFDKVEMPCCSEVEGNGIGNTYILKVCQWPTSRISE